MTRPAAALSRRTLIAVASGAGVAAATTQVLRAMESMPPQAAARASHGGPRGYRITEHIARYYRTARV